MKELFQEIQAWAMEEFFTSRGRKPDAVPPLRHLMKGLENELIPSPCDLTEYADAFMLLINAVQLAGYSYDDVIAALREKLEINKRRAWGPIGPDGVIEHVRGEAL